MPFAAGILAESDLDYPVAKALAAELYEIPAFSTATEAACSAAAERMRSIGKVLCTVPAFGETNAANKDLYEAAKEAGILTGADAFLKGVEA